MRRFAAFLTLALLAAAPATAAGQEKHEHSGNMTHVKNLPYAPDNGGTPNFGTRAPTPRRFHRA